MTHLFSGDVPNFRFLVWRLSCFQWLFRPCDLENRNHFESFGVLAEFLVNLFANNSEIAGVRALLKITVTKFQKKNRFAFELISALQQSNRMIFSLSFGSCVNRKILSILMSLTNFREGDRRLCRRRKFSVFRKILDCKKNEIKKFTSSAQPSISGLENVA